MQMRLAFSIAVHVYSDILLVDEVLAVGDLAFQRKCLERIEAVKKEGCAILLVSHDATLVGQLCNEALWLEAGRLAAIGPAQQVVDRFLQSIRFETQRRTPPSVGPRQLPDGNLLQVHKNRFGSLEMELVSVRLSDAEVPALILGSLRVELEYQAPQEIEAPIFGVSLSREEGLTIFESSISGIDLHLPRLKGRGKVTLCIDRLDLSSGFITWMSELSKDWAYAYDYHWHAYPLRFSGADGAKGLLLPPQRWEHQG
jgi:lipopolysaccharide transport system ATP-binding protein